jgi:PAS domain S-box-containing protein
VSESENLYRTFFESSRDALMVMEPPLWNFILCNAAAVAMFGAKALAELQSKSPAELSVENQPDGQPSRDKAPAMIRKAVEAGSSFFNWRHRRLTGEEFDATVLLTRVESEGKTYVQATVRDVTEMKKIESSLQQARIELAQRNAQLQKKMLELVKFTSLSMGRELRIAELKAELVRLKPRPENTTPGEAPTLTLPGGAENSALKARVMELEKLAEVALGRESRIAELKDEIRTLRAEVAHLRGPLAKLG